MTVNQEVDADDVFEYGREVVDVTSDGWFGGPVDTERRYQPGLSWYTINGVPVTEGEYKARLLQNQNRKVTHNSE